MKEFLDVEYKEGLQIDMYLPDNCEDGYDVFVYFHGGGLEKGSRRGTKVFAQPLCEKGVGVASVEYRMYPDAKFPDFIEDCAEAVAYLKAHAGEYGKLRRIFVGGSSAGGYLSMMLCFDRKYLEAVGMKPTDIAAYIHDAGQPTAHLNVLKREGEDGRRVIVDERAPMYFVGRDESYSPMLFIVSDEDMFARYEQTILMVKTLEHFGHKENVHLAVQNSKHCKYVYKVDEAGESVFANIILPFLDKVFPEE